MHAAKLAGTALIVTTAFVVGPRLDAPAQVELGSAVSPPSGELHGRLELASFGLAVLEPAAGPPRAALHVRFALDNADETSWRLDVREAIVAIDGAPPVRAFAANGEPRTLPIALVLPGERATIDAFFAVAPGALPAQFLITYRVATPGRVFVRSTSFARALVAPHPPAPRGGTTWWLASAREPQPVAVVWSSAAGYEESVPGAEPWPRRDECDQW